MITLDLSILNQKGTPMFYSDTLALRPAFGIVGRIFIAIDSPYGIYRDTGTAWDQIAGTGGAGITGTGTATQIAYFIGVSSIASSSNLFWDNTNSRLGVNTATPGSSLDVHSAVQSVIQVNNTILGNSFLSFQLQGTGKWQIGNVYNAGANYFRIQDQLNSLERFTIQNTGEIDFLGWQQTINTVTGITGTTPSALPNSGFQNDFTFNSGISSSASVNAIGLLVDNGLNYSGANTINATSYNASGLFRIGLTFGSAAASITYIQGATGQIRALTSNQVQYIQNGNNSGTISHYATIQILGDNKTGSGLTTFTNRYGLLINDFNDFGVGNTYTNRWGIYQQGLNENNFFAGKVGIGSGYVPSAYQLDVIGTSIFQDNLFVNKNQDASTSINISNINNAALSTALLTFTSNASSIGYIGKYSTLATTYKILKGKDFSIFNNVQGDISILNDVFNGNIYFSNSGLADSLLAFTYAGRLLVGNVAESTYKLDVNGTARIAGASLIYSAAFTNLIALNLQNTVSLSTFKTTAIDLTAQNGDARLLAGNESSGSGTNGFFALYTRTSEVLTEKYRVTSSGSFILGSTSETSSAIMKLSSITKGFLPPTMTSNQKNAISSPVAGLVVYDTTLNKLCVYTTAWQTITSV
jgi:hypothetical protein